MENNRKFRNHASIILEKSMKTIGTMAAVFLLNIVSDVEEVGITSSDILFLVVVVAVILGVVLGYQTLLWAKTYISVEENTLVIERDTINAKRNTIGHKNVSNDNLEQNLLEMILGTCKVKLDTNSLSTAYETDVNIVLKKVDAEEFRRFVLAKAEGQPYQASGEMIEEKEDGTEEEPSGTTLRGSLGDLMLHGVFSIRTMNIILIAGILFICFSAFFSRSIIFCF